MACPVWETGMPLSIPVLSGAVPADRDKAGHRTPHHQPHVLAQIRAKSLAGGQGMCHRGQRSMGQARSSHTGQRVAPTLFCTPQQGGCRGWGALCLLPLHHGWEPVCFRSAKIDANDFGPQLQAAARGSKSTGKRGKHGLGQALPPNY